MLRSLLSGGSLALLALLAWNASSNAQLEKQATGRLGAKQVEFFETKIRPILVTHCYECHSSQAAKVKGGLLLDTRDGIRKGGESGPAILPGKPEASLLIQALRHEKLKMPNAKTRLPDAVIDAFTQWVAMGAPDPRDGSNSLVTKITLEDARSWWSLKPLNRPPTPKVKDAGWARTDVDRFIFDKLHTQGLKPAAEAEPRVLIRRLYFDLTGLPPAPAEVEQFVKAAAANRSAAIEKTVDHLLASPRFGERWGRYWLDIARYAESNGNADNVPFPNAWRYRDWVIAAVNQDKPYDQFIREQIAGDLLEAADSKQRDELLIATGFLALTSKPRAQNNPDYRFDLIADQIDVTTRGVLGMSVMCARCHDHKFDPVSTKEYYGLAGIFESTMMLAGAAGKGGKGAGPGGQHALSEGGQAMGVREGKLADCRICLRGESANLGDQVPRGLLAAPTIGPPTEIDRSQSGRLELAQWLTRRDNPLTARVAVNRIWLHLFGEGIVRSPDNFGALGERPSHPQLLDWLAMEFMDQGWSTKKMIKTVVLSRTYQLSSQFDAAAHKIDPDNRLFWRMNQRRLDAEATRDAILAVSGQIDLTPPGRSLSTFTGARGKGVSAPQPETAQRSVYLGIVRGAPLPESLAMFDVANPNLVVAQREVTTVPAQALYLMNSPFIVEQSGHLAGRLLAPQGLDDAGRVALAYQLTLSRPPTDAERARSVNYLAQIAADQKVAWTSFCQALLASAEFRYLR